jgi:exodeoxyribonuclease-3
MKLATFNINGYRAITGISTSKRKNATPATNQLQHYISASKPDVICLQEMRVLQQDIKNADELLPYKITLNSAEQKGYSGVATLSPHNLNHKLGIDIEQFDIEGRVITTRIDDIVLLNVYFPNGGNGDRRLQYKMDFYDALFQYTEQIRKTEPNIVICGDYNTAHNEIDLSNPKSNTNNSGFMPMERKKLDDIVEMGYVDAFRLKHNEPEQYTWWSNFRNARERNIGWRIDYFFVTDSLVDRVVDCYIEPEVMGSDHCPVVLELLK